MWVNGALWPRSTRLFQQEREELGPGQPWTKTRGALSAAGDRPGRTICPAAQPPPLPGHDLDGQTALGLSSRSIGIFFSTWDKQASQAPLLPRTVCRRRPWEAGGADRPPGYAEASSGRPGKGRGLLHPIAPGWARPALPCPAIWDPPMMESSSPASGSMGDPGRDQE